MNQGVLRIVLLSFAALTVAAGAATAQDLDQIGYPLLQTVTTNLNGSGIRVAQPEAALSSTPDTFEVDPANENLAASRFSYFASNSSVSVYPNALGTNSWHAQWVGTNFYQPLTGVATNVAHIDNYDASYFANGVVGATFPTNINDPIVNQSFDAAATVSQEESIDTVYDSYAARFGILFVSATGDGGQISPPSTCYNGIAVACCDGETSYGPTPDNSRSKPDLTAPGTSTSFSTPFVSGSAAVLLQAALRGTEGGNTNAAADMRTLKALLINGAIKPIGWTNFSPAPLDTRYGAGVLNVFNSYEELAFGKHPWIVSNSVTSGAQHPPTGATGTVGVNSGWDFDSIASTAIPAMDAATHYYFNLSNGVYTATATLVWNLQYGKSSINHLALFLYNAANSNLVMESTSVVDNVQHIFVPNLAPGRYDLQVWKAGGTGFASASESYALAWAFTAPTFRAARSGSNVIFTWPIYPAGYALQAAASLTQPAWSTNNVPGPTFTTGTNVVTLPANSGMQFFRLQQPGS